MDAQQIQGIVEQYCRNDSVVDDGIKITRLANWKTVFVEQIGKSGQSISMNVYKVDGAKCWAGYSPHSQTVYISLSA
ncbi:MAG: hypothetical protein AB1894_04620 [Chloroflexota bacterium]